MARLAISVVLMVIAFGDGSALAQTFNSGSTGADGAFSPTTNTTLTLPPNGVFNFTTITIPAGVTVTVTRNAANTPVTMLASGNVTISGTINLNAVSGGNASSGTSIAPNAGVGGPGGGGGGDGADGLTSTTGGAGLGPGGGGGGVFTADFGGRGSGGGGGSFGTTGGTGGLGLVAAGATYGVNTLVPLIGGSGGGGASAPFGFTAAGGGGGAGTILIASSGTLIFTGSITAIGGNGGNALSSTGSAGAGGGGSGGGVRLVATTITGSGGSISVAGGSPGGVNFNPNQGGGGGAGRIRIEAFTNMATISFAQVPSLATPGALALPGAPSLTITSVAGIAAPASPTGSYANPDVTLPAGTANPMSIALAASNIPLGTTVTVTVKPQNGAASSAVSSGLEGTLAASTATASLTIPTNQPSVISASATFTLATVPGAGPLYAGGEAVERVRVAAILGEPAQVTYITTSGREVAADTVENLR